MSGIGADPQDCPTLRGGLFSNRTSNSWVPITCSGEQFCGLPYSDAQNALGYSGNAQVGLDTVLLGSGSNSPRVSNQVVAAYAEQKPLFGVFGLSNYSSHVRSTTIGDPTALQSLKAAGAISSHYYGYTAGAYHQDDPPQFASLTLGGWDATRGNSNASRLAVPLGDDSTRDLLVTIQGITIGTGSALDTVAGMGITANVDSLVPEIWLPDEACSTFESAFGLEWNDTAGYYTVNDAQHATMVGQNRSVVFSLGANDTSTPIQIALPYAAFDQELKWPLANITDTNTRLRYFPLRRAGTDARKYTLGRTFLQHA